MALQPNSPDSPHAIPEADIRGFPADEALWECDRGVARSGYRPSSSKALACRGVFSVIMTNVPESGPRDIE